MSAFLKKKLNLSFIFHDLTLYIYRSNKNLLISNNPTTTISVQRDKKNGKYNICNEAPSMV